MEFLGERIKMIFFLGKKCKLLFCPHGNTCLYKCVLNLLDVVLVNYLLRCHNLIVVFTLRFRIMVP